MLFNFGKSKRLHTGHGNLDVNYKIGDTVIGTIVKEKDLGLTLSADMKVSEQCGIAASKVIKFLDYENLHCIHAWRPHRKKDIDTLERIQR